MSDLGSRKLRSHLFDRGLIEKGDWEEKWKKEFILWNEENFINLQKERALDIMKNIIVSFLKGDSVPRGRVKIDRLGRMLDKLEQLLISTKALDDKYYRDHLNHSIRVTLLSKLISRYKPFELNGEDINFLILSSIFHDLSYPLSQVHRIINTTIKSIKRGYNIANNIPEDFKTEFNVEENLLKLIFGDNIKEAVKKIENFDHGILSALEFISYIKSEDEVIKKYKGVIKDIAFHTPLSEEIIIDTIEKRLMILILADEIQDWGRPNNFGLISISKIDPFIINDNKIICNFIVDDFKNYSLLRQLYGKMHNLNRLELDTTHEIQLTYPYFNYYEIYGKKIISDVKTLYNECIKFEDIFNQEKNIFFYKENHEAEEIYYGMNIPSKYKYTIKKMLNNNKLEDINIFNKKILLNSLSKEALIVNKSFSIVNYIVIKNINGKIYITIDDNKGYLKGIFENESKEIILEIAAIIKFSNAIIMKLSNYTEKKFPYEIGIEKFPNELETNFIKEQYMIDMNLNKFKELIDAIASNGVYLFTS